MNLRWDILVDYLPLFMSGVWMTLKLVLVSLSAGLVLGLLLGLLRSTEEGPKPRQQWLRPILSGLRLLAKVYVTFFRGTPLFVQILLVHFALMPLLINADGGLLISGDMARTFRQEHGALASGVLALLLNSGAYISEIIRAGVQSIHQGQIQASWSLGLTHAQTMRFIVLPQAFRRMMPALINEGVTLIKDSSLVSAIGLAEIAFAARTVAGAHARYWEPYLAISAIYLVLTFSLAWLGGKLEAPSTQRGR